MVRIPNQDESIVEEEHPHDTRATAHVGGERKNEQSD